MNDKDILRKEMLDIRAEAAARDPDAAEKLADVFPMKLFERYGPVVAHYLPIRDELSPAPLMQRLSEAGAQAALPRLEDDGSMSFRFWQTGDALIEGKFGLLEPAESAPVAKPSLVLVPLLAFDAMGNRLGYGKGHYDRALASLREAGRAFACAVAYKAQMLDLIPSEPHDEPLDWAATERGSVPLFMMRASAEQRV
ncbi:MAG: 5-formyltetrahydrofolate cyclo-ligase [Hyphomonadaceae bacterium]